MISARTSFWLRCLASLVLIAWIASKVNWASLGALFSHVNIPIAISTSALTPLLIVMLAVRWRIFLRQQEIGIPFHGIIGLTWAGQFFNSVLPGSTGGDVVKTFQVCRMHPKKKAAAVVTVVCDRLCALFVLAILAAAGFIFGPPLPVLQLGFSLSAMWLVMGIGISGLALVLILYALRDSRRAEQARHFFSVLKNSLRWNWMLAGAAILSAAIHLLNFTLFFGFAHALGLSISYEQVLTMMPIILTLLLLPLTINGHGLREALLVFYFSYWKISVAGELGSNAAELALSVSLLGVANDLLWSIPGGLWYFSTKRA